MTVSTLQKTPRIKADVTDLCLKSQALADSSFRTPAIQPPYSVLSKHTYNFFPRGQDERSLANTEIHFSNMIGNDFSVNKTEIITALRQGFR